MKTATDDIKVIEGSQRVLLIAPHGHRKDDENTAELAQLASGRLGCQAIVNRIFRKPRGSAPPDLAERRLDLNQFDQASRHPWFLKSIRATVDAPGRTLVVWVHGIRDENIQAQARCAPVYAADPNRLLALAGYGQGQSPKTRLPHDCFTAYPQTARRLVDLLTANGLTAMAARIDAPNYRGRHEDNMNQWLHQNRYPLTSVESIQLEFKYTGVRDHGSLGAAAQALANALEALV